MALVDTSRCVLRNPNGQMFPKSLLKAASCSCVIFVIGQAYSLAVKYVCGSCCLRCRQVLNQFRWVAAEFLTRFFVLSVMAQAILLSAVV
eukprot:2139103-Amphidinium_carterae.1